MISRLLLKTFGFTVDPSMIECLKKQRIGIFPHTSKIEVCILSLVLWSTNNRGKICFAVAHKYMEIPILGHILAYFGGFPVINGTGVTKSTIKFLKENPDKSLAISPEGSLQPKEWKTGFFYIAKELQIPIVVFGIDFNTHVIKCCLDKEIMIQHTDDPKDKIPEIMEIFRETEITPLFPLNSYPIIKNSIWKTTSYIPLQGKIFLLLSLIIILKMKFT